MSEAMKALTIWQPWASAVPLGVKSWETRSWQTAYRGLLAIHAAKTPTKLGLAFYQTELTLGRLPKGGLPFGAVLCIVRIVKILPTVEAELEISSIEKLYGDYTLGRFAWKFELVEVFDRPIPAVGKQGLWTWRKPS